MGREKRRNARVAEVVQIKRGITRRCVYRIVHGELDHGELFTPILWVRQRKAAQHRTDDAVRALCLTIRFGMISSRHTEARADKAKELLPKGSGKSWITIRY